MSKEVGHMCFEGEISFCACKIEALGFLFSRQQSGIGEMANGGQDRINTGIGSLLDGIARDLREIERELASGSVHT